MAWTLAPAIRSLIDSANRVSPDRNRRSDGTIGDAAHANRPSDHNPDSDRMVCAVDLTHDPPRWDCNTRAQQAIADPRTKYVIWNRRIWKRSSGWQPYSGSNPHDKHMHVSVTQAGKQDPSPWLGYPDRRRRGLDSSGADPNSERWDEMATKEEIKEAFSEVLLTWTGPPPDGFERKPLSELLGEIREGVRRIARKTGA